MTGLLGQIALAFIITFFLSRLVHWALDKWDGGMRKLFLVHLVTLLIAWAFYTLATDDGLGLHWSSDVLSMYLVPQIIWFGVDIMLGKARRRAF